MDGFGRLVEMECAGPAGGVDAIPVIEAIGEVAVLLNFGEENAAPDGVDGTGADENGVAQLDRESWQDLSKSTGFRGVPLRKASAKLIAGHGIPIRAPARPVLIPTPRRGVTPFARGCIMCPCAGCSASSHS